MSGQVVRETWTESGTEHILDIITDNGGRPYALVYDGTTYYYVLNQQGDVIRLVDYNGATVARYTYNAWGEVLSVQGPNGNVGADHIANINPIRYRGYYYDSETGFYYLQSRYYDPVLCRFINADGYVSTGSGFLGCNMYAYCNNNPVSTVDQDATIVFTAIGAATGALSSGVSEALKGGDAASVLYAAACGAASGAVSGIGADIAAFFAANPYTWVALEIISGAMSGVIGVALQNENATAGDFLSAMVISGFTNIGTYSSLNYVETWSNAYSGAASSIAKGSATNLVVGDAKFTTSSGKAQDSKTKSTGKSTGKSSPKPLGHGGGGGKGTFGAGRR